MLRMLTTIPPGKVRFTIIDPVGLGENFAAFMHLADYDDTWSPTASGPSRSTSKQRLADLTEHMENVIQKYLRNEFETIDEYNAYAGEVAEPFRILVVANFPANFTETAARRLMSIATSGARCGVYTLMMTDTNQPLPLRFDLKDLDSNATNLAWDGKQIRLERRRLRQVSARGRVAAAGRAIHADRAVGRRERQGLAARRGAVRIHRPGRRQMVDRQHGRTASTCRWAAPARRSCSICGSATARRSTCSSPARPAPANRRCCTR